MESDEEDRSEIEPRIEIWKDDENKEEDKEYSERDFLQSRPKNVIPARYKSESDESITFPNDVIAMRCCWTDSPNIIWSVSCSIH